MIVDETRLEAFAQFGLGKPRDHNGGGAEHLISITKRVCITIIVIITVVSSRHWCLMASRADDPSSRCTSSDGIRYGLGKPRNDEGADACPRSGPRTRPADPSCWYASNASAPDVVVDSTTRPADARRATAFVTDSASLATTRGRTHVRSPTRPARRTNSAAPRAG